VSNESNASNETNQ